LLVGREGYETAPTSKTFVTSHIVILKIDHTKSSRTWFKLVSFGVRGDETVLGNPVDTVSNRPRVMFETRKDALPVLKRKGAILLSYCFASRSLKPRSRDIE
jgi:hypothetical protein